MLVVTVQTGKSHEAAIVEEKGAGTSIAIFIFAESWQSNILNTRLGRGRFGRCRASRGLNNLPSFLPPFPIQASLRNFPSARGPVCNEPGYPPFCIDVVVIRERESESAKVRADVRAVGVLIQDW